MDLYTPVNSASFQCRWFEDVGRICSHTFRIQNLISLNFRSLSPNQLNLSVQFRTSLWIDDPRFFQISLTKLQLQSDRYCCVNTSWSIWGSLFWTELWISGNTPTFFSFFIIFINKDVTQLTKELKPLQHIYQQAKQPKYVTKQIKNDKNCA